MKKLVISTMLILSLALTALVGCAPIIGVTQADLAKDVFTLDVNPGVRIYVDDANTVMSIEATNDDGEEIVASIEVIGLDYQVAVDAVLSEIFDRGYLEDTNSVLVSYEKLSVEELEVAVKDKINEVFERHNRIASIIAQDVHNAAKELKNMADELDISLGKAILIETIRSEYPTLTAEELAALDINDLNIMLEGLREEVRSDIKSYGEAMIEKYISRKQALENALTHADVLEDDLIYSLVRIDREDGKMVWEVDFASGTLEYEYTVDALSGEILEYESEEYEPFDYDSVVGDFKDKIENVIGGILGGLKAEVVNSKEALEKALAVIHKDIKEVDDIDIEYRRDENGAVFEIEIETEDDNEYLFYIEASGGKVVKAYMNGNALDVENTSATE